MARNSKVGKKQHSPKPRSGGSSGRVRRGRPKICIFCSQHATWVDYKDVTLLRRFVSDRGKIKARGATGTCAQHQRDVAVAVKTARELALLPYAVRTAATDPGDRRGRRGRPGEGPSANAAASTAGDSASTAGDSASPDSDSASEADEQAPNAGDAVSPEEESQSAAATGTDDVDANGAETVSAGSGEVSASLA